MSLQKTCQKSLLGEHVLEHTAFLLVLNRVVRFNTALSSVDFPAFARPVQRSMVGTLGLQEDIRRTYKPVTMI